MVVYLFGYLVDDFFGRVIVTKPSQTVAALAGQLAAWSWEPERIGPFTVTNEAGAVLDPTWTIEQAGLENGAIFKVDPQRLISESDGT